MFRVTAMGQVPSLADLTRWSPAGALAESGFCDALAAIGLLRHEPDPPGTRRNRHGRLRAGFVRSLRSGAPA